MFLEILGFMLFGILIGVIAGLMPGLHPNTVFVIMLSFTAFFSGFPVICTIAFIVSLSVSNVFLDFVPSILFGAPDPDTCLSVLPGHQMLMDGHGYEAVFLSVIGGLTAVVLTLATLPILLFVLPALYSQIHPIILFLLIAIVGWMVWTERGVNKLWAILIFLLTGIFGLITLNSFSDAALFPSLTGLFGFSGLVMAVYGKPDLPEQRKTCRLHKGAFKGAVTGWFAGMLAGILPGIGSSQASMVTGQAFRSKAKDFLVSMGGISAANIIFTLVAFYTLGKTRSGAVAAIAQLSPNLSGSELLLLMVVCLVTAFLSVIITLKSAELAIVHIHAISYKKLNISIIAFLLLAVFIFTGFLGLLISSGATLLGVAAIKLGIKRSHMMGFLIFPTMLYFAGLSAPLSAMLGI